ncbi:hypothetical protein WICPIJ_003066 [Wickerhamomyces pijperi]|uniref:PH domain-containing protein n=1 Tax=Wickerhamomyces pijperi TaxID=599730 RepID=A0A9P8QAL5_WICPI|nr:hypothetical protein WICPIJ_003066 [Wickerhamomyces pijperi]
METIDVQSKSFVVKWVQIPNNSTVTFQLKPIKKSVGFSIYKSTSPANNNSNSNNGGEAGAEIPAVRSPGSLHDLKTSLEDAVNNNSVSVGAGVARRASIYQSNNSSTSSLQRKRSTSNVNMNLTLEERLQKSSLAKVQSYGTLQGNDVFQNELTISEGGIYAFIFDNTFSKNNSKKVLFNKFIVDNQHGSCGDGGNGDLTVRHRNSSTTSLSNGKFEPSSTKLLQGYLLKKKRKRLQGFTKRFFILNFKYNTLTYYMNENSLKIRGEMQINISSVTAFENEHTIVIDSGMDVWFLKTLNKNDWSNWINALDYIKMNNTPPLAHRSSSFSGSPAQSSSFKAVADVQDKSAVASVTPSSAAAAGDVLQRRKVSRIIEEQDPLSKVNELSYISDKLESIHLKLTNTIDQEANFELNELRQYIKSLLIESPLIQSSDIKNVGSELSRTTSPLSLDTYYDAEDSLSLEDTQYKKSHHVHVLEGNTAGSSSAVEDEVEVDELSDDEEDDWQATAGTKLDTSVEDKQASLAPLPILTPVKRRNDVPKSTSQPPSLFSFLRKNVGKDLTSLSMPVTSNEPITILQKIAEVFEYSSLLTEAMNEPNPEIKLLKISTFAVSNLAAMRSKERNLRKPFNPILGETFEFVDEVQNIRLVGEKINHKPQVFAMHVDSKDWECSFNILPDQKFWGKSIELSNKGYITLICKHTGQVFKWMPPTTVLKNIIAGEKYSEPANPITISSSIGLKSVIEFKKPNSGLFSSGRSEELTVKLIDINTNQATPLYATGTWTQELQMKSTSNASLSKSLWKPVAFPADEASKWGFTYFAMNLNEITAIEKDKIPYTDSRFRPDVQIYESGDIEKAEVLKLDIEQIQRDRRKELADAGEVHVPRFFKKPDTSFENLEDELLHYEFIKGEKSYWSLREAGNWGDDSFKLW